MKKTPMRRCVGCMTSKPKNELTRIACYEGEVHVDPSGKAKGRGVEEIALETAAYEEGAAAS